MLKRKISETLKKWKEQPNHFPLVIMGIRQCGKTYISELFAEENYKHVVYINFIKQKRRKEAFYDSKDVDSIILNLSAQMRTAKFVPGETCIILDEIQDCPEARTSLKFFKEDGRYDIIATGSLLGVQGYGQDEKKQRTRKPTEQEKGSNSGNTCTKWYPCCYENAPVSLCRCGRNACRCQCTDRNGKHG